MKKYFFSLVMMLHTSSIFAQVTAPEPEFINSYCILTSDATYDQLPKESGTIGKHENKAKKSRQKFTIQSFIKELAANDSIVSILSSKIISVKILCELDKRTAPVFNIVSFPKTANRTYLAVPMAHYSVENCLFHTFKIHSV